MTFQTIPSLDGYWATRSRPWLSSLISSARVDHDMFATLISDGIPGVSNRTFSSPPPGQCFGPCTRTSASSMLAADRAMCAPDVSPSSVIEGPLGCQFDIGGGKIRPRSDDQRIICLRKLMLVQAATLNAVRLCAKLSLVGIDLELPAHRPTRSIHRCVLEIWRLPRGVRLSQLQHTMVPQECKRVQRCMAHRMALRVLHDQPWRTE